MKQYGMLRISASACVLSLCFFVYLKSDNLRCCNMIWQRALMQEPEKEQVYRYQRDYDPRHDFTCAWIWLSAENPIPRESWLPIHLLSVAFWLYNHMRSRYYPFLWLSILSSCKIMKFINPEVGYGLQESVLDTSPSSLTTGLIGLKPKNIVSKSWSFFSWLLIDAVCSAVHALTLKELLWGIKHICNTIYKHIFIFNIYYNKI